MGVDLEWGHWQGPGTGRGRKAHPPNCGVDYVTGQHGGHR